MTDYLFYLLLGSGAGAIIAALGMGLVITYQGSGVVNFALGAMATWSAYVYADLRTGSYPFPIPGLPDRYHFGGSLEGDVGFRLAIALALATAAAMGGLVYLLVFRPLRSAPALAKVVASVGLTIVFLSLVDRRFPDTSIRVDPILPREPVTIAGDLTVPRDGLWLAAIVIGLGVLLWAGSRFTKIGLATRAAATNEKGAILLGYSPERLAGFSFVTASLVTSIVAILAAPQIQLRADIFTFGYLVPALGAALIGTFRNLGPTIAAGLAIGMVQSTFTKLQGDISWWPEYGAREGLPFLVIIVAMMLLGERLPERGSVDIWRLASVPAARVTVATVAIPLVGALAGLVLLGPLWRAAIMTTVIAVVMSLSFVILTGFAGQTSLAQMAVAGVAGFTLSRLAIRFDIPFPIAPLLAALAAAAFGVLIGLPALRLRGTNLAIVTLAAGVAVNEFVFKNPSFVGDVSTGGAKVPNPSLFGWDFGLILGTKSSRPVFGIALVIVALLLALAVANVRRSSTGRRLLAIRSNERAAAAAGISVMRVKMLAFGLSAFIAGCAGCLIAYRFGSVSDMSYGLFASLTALAVAYLGGITSVSGAVTAGIVATAGVAFFGMSQIIGSLGPWSALIGGVLLIVTAIQNPEGIAGAIRSKAAEARRAKEAAAADATAPAIASAQPETVGA
ncbi:MAG: ABC transporter permease [Ilumatobacteraceae bacterium]|jgi:branched-chain amino acid transport system permease protein|nr:ABC transporter permease [Ilumatobacteraceae bacterium]